MDSKIIRESLDALRKEVEPLEKQIYLLNQAIKAFQKICPHSRTDMWSTRHGSYTEHYICLDCGVEWEE